MDNFFVFSSSFYVFITFESDGIEESKEEVLSWASCVFSVI